MITYIIYTLYPPQSDAIYLVHFSKNNENICPLM